MVRFVGIVLGPSSLRAVWLVGIVSLWSRLCLEMHIHDVGNDFDLRDIYLTRVRDVVDLSITLCFIGFILLCSSFCVGKKPSSSLSEYRLLVY